MFPRGKRYKLKLICPNGKRHKIMSISKGVIAGRKYRLKMSRAQREIYLSALTRAVFFQIKQHATRFFLQVSAKFHIYIDGWMGEGKDRSKVKGWMDGLVDDWLSMF